MWPFTPNVEKMRSSGDVCGLIGASSHRNPHVGTEAVQALAQFSDPSAADAVCGALHNDSADVRRTAIRSLATMAKDPTLSQRIAENMERADIEIIVDNALSQEGTEYAAAELLRACDQHAVVSTIAGRIFDSEAEATAILSFEQLANAAASLITSLFGPACASRAIREANSDHIINAIRKKYESITVTSSLGIAFKSWDYGGDRAKEAESDAIGRGFLDQLGTEFSELVETVHSILESGDPQMTEAAVRGVIQGIRSATDIGIMDVFTPEGQSYQDVLVTKTISAIPELNLTKEELTRRVTEQAPEADAP